MPPETQSLLGDPTQRTIETVHREIKSVEKWAELQLQSAKSINDEREDSARRESTLMEAHRLELKADGEAHRLELKADSGRAVSTAMIAAEKAVQAAMAAAEKALAQQTIASQLATNKAETAFAEQLRQQKDSADLRFDTVINGVNDTKALLGELRAEKRGVQEQVIVARDNTEDMKPLVDAVAALVASQQQLMGRGLQTTEHRATLGQMIAIAAIGSTLFVGLLAATASVLSRILV